MIREYCDSCHKEIAVSEFKLHPGEDTKRWTRTRYEVIVKMGPDLDHGPVNPGEPFETTIDVLCPDCARKFAIEVEG